MPAAKQSVFRGLVEVAFAVEIRAVFAVVIPVLTDCAAEPMVVEGQFSDIAAQVHVTAIAVACG